MVNEKYFVAASGIFALGWVTIIILNLIGLVYLTNMTFKSKLENDKLCLEDMNITKRNIARMTIVLLWITLVISLLSGLYSFKSSSKNSFSF